MRTNVGLSKWLGWIIKSPKRLDCCMYRNDNAQQSQTTSSWHAETRSVVQLWKLKHNTMSNVFRNLCIHVFARDALTKLVASNVKLEADLFRNFTQSDKHGPIMFHKKKIELVEIIPSGIRRGIDFWSFRSIILVSKPRFLSSEHLKFTYNCALRTRVLLNSWLTDMKIEIVVPLLLIRTWISGL